VAKKVADLIGFQNNYLGKPKEGLKLFNTYNIKLSKGADFGPTGYMYLNAAVSYYYKGDIDISFEYYAIAKDYALKANNEKLYAYAVMYTGYNESELGKFAEASKSLKEASSIFLKLKDTTNILGAKNALGILYSRNAFFEEAEKERNESILMIGDSDRHRALTNLYFNAAEDNKKNKRF
jgi:tetratricopeptide (TPR) repeat protein